MTIDRGSLSPLTILPHHFSYKENSWSLSMLQICKPIHAVTYHVSLTGWRVAVRSVAGAPILNPSIPLMTIVHCDSVARRNLPDPVGATDGV